MKNLAKVLKRPYESFHAGSQDTAKEVSDCCKDLEPPEEIPGLPSARVRVVVTSSHLLYRDSRGPVLALIRQVADFIR
jgi:hypothetical protein